MAKQKLGMGPVETNKKFRSREQAFLYARRLQHFIKYTCEKYKDKGYLAQAMIVVSETKKGTSNLRYVNTGKRGRPPKELVITTGGWYKDYKTDWHLHVIVVSKPSYAFRNKIKDYIDRRWADIEQEYDVEPFDVSKLEKGAFKRKGNIGLADYFIKQSADIMFCNYNFGEEEGLKYTLKEYYREYMKVDSRKRKLYKKQAEQPMSEEKYLKKLDKIEKSYKDIFNYFKSITCEDDMKQEEAFNKNVRRRKVAENSNKHQELNYRRDYAPPLF